MRSDAATVREVNGHAEAAWKAMLDADLNARYWRAMVLRFSRREGHAKIFLAVVASAAVGSWSLWIEAQWLWKTLSAVAAIVSVAMPIIDVPRKTEVMTEAYAAWLQLMHDYDDLWLGRDKIDEATFVTRLSSLRTREVDVAKKTAKLPSDDMELSERCYAEVLNSRALSE